VRAAGLRQGRARRPDRRRPAQPHLARPALSKGSASKQLVTGPQRERKVRYRAPYSTEWTELDLGTAMEMVADRVLDARRKGWQDTDDQGRPLRRTMGIASLGGATLDNEENYLIKKLFTALGAIQIENQARI